MKKLLTVLSITLLGTMVFAASYGGFTSQVNVASVEELTLGDSLTMDTSGEGMINFDAQINYDGWSIVAYGPGLVNVSQNNHTIPLTLKVVADGATAPTAYDTLGATEGAATTIQTGDYIGSGSAFDLYVKGNATEYAQARAGYYSAYVNVKIVSLY